MPRGGRVKRYTADFKQSAIELAMSGDATVSQIARDLNMSEKTLHNWLKVHKDKNNVHSAEIQKESLEEELKRLRKENAILKKEREILKKATAYFAKETL